MKKVILIATLIFTSLIIACNKSNPPAPAPPVPPSPVSSTFTDSRDGQTYDLVKIGNQTWFAENLNYQTIDSWCYDNASSNCDTFGRLYYWNSAMFACPQGFHLPSREEWNELIDTLGGLSLAGDKMKSFIGWKSPNSNSNISGFSGLGSGSSFNNNFNDKNKETFFWSSFSAPGFTEKYCLRLRWNWSYAQDYSMNPNRGLCVRCLKD